MVCLVTRSRHAFTHFCCYFTYFVHVTFTTLQRNGRSHHFLQKNTIQNQHFWSQIVSGLSWASIWHAQGDIRPNWDDILTKYEQKCNFFKMSMSQKSKNVSFSGIKAPQGATRHKGAFEKLTSRKLIHVHDEIENGLFP